MYPQQKRAYSARHPQAWTSIYSGPCPKALTECSPLDFRRSSIATVKRLLIRRSSNVHIKLKKTRTEHTLYANSKHEFTTYVLWRKVPRAALAFRFVFTPRPMSFSALCVCMSVSQCACALYWHCVRAIHCVCVCVCVCARARDLVCVCFCHVLYENVC